MSPPLFDISAAQGRRGRHRIQDFLGNGARHRGHRSNEALDAIKARPHQPCAGQRRRSGERQQASPGRAAKEVPRKARRVSS